MDRNNLDPQVRAAIQRGRQDFVFFCWYFLGITLHPGQIRFARERRGIVNILVPGNRYGKTVLLACFHVWYCFYKVGLYEGHGTEWQKAHYQTAALAPTSEVLDVMYKTIKAIMTSSFVISKEGEPIRTNQCRLGWYIVLESCRNTAPYFVQFRDNTSVRFFSGSDDKFSNVQGKKFGYGGYDEGGRSYHLEYELKSNLIPRFQEMGAPLDLASTPDQRSPSIVYHHEIFQKGLRGEDGFFSFKGSARENSYLPNVYFEGIERSLAGDPLLAQVLNGEFVFAGDTLYRQEDIDRALDKSLNGGVRYQKDHKYIIATDTSLGRADEQVYTALDVPEGFSLVNPDPDKALRLVRQVGFIGISKSPQMAMQEYIDLWEAYNKGKTVRGALETFNEGSARWYYDLPDGIKRKTKCYGSWQPPAVVKTPARNTSSPTTNSGKKVDMLVALRKVLTAGMLRIPEDNKELIQQLNMYREDDVKLKTDRVISLALACWMAVEGTPSVTKAKAIPINW